MKTKWARSWGYRQILSIAGAIATTALMSFVLTGCSDDEGATASIVPAPGAPTNFTVVRTPEATLSANLAWSAPTTGGAPTTYEVYRSTTSGAVFDASNHVISLPATTVAFYRQCRVDLRRYILGGHR